MSKGFGSVQRQILATLHATPRRNWSAAELAEALLGGTTAAKVVSVRRAISGLLAAGAIAVVPTGTTTKFFTIAAREKRRTARERKREEANRRHQFYYGGENPFHGFTAEALLRAAEGAGRSAERHKLVKALGMLGSAHEGERLAAARAVEEIRKRLGLSWSEILGEN